MSKPVLFLRIASALTLIHAVLHTVGGVFGKIDPGPASVAVEAMKVNHFLFMGSIRSFWEFQPIAVISLNYFFLVPVLVEAVIAVLLGLAFVAAKPEAAGAAGAH
jgi:hypothetical protein